MMVVQNDIERPSRRRFFMAAACATTEALRAAPWPPALPKEN